MRPSGARNLWQSPVLTVNCPGAEAPAKQSLSQAEIMNLSWLLLLLPPTDTALCSAMPSLNRGFKKWLHTEGNIVSIKKSFG